MKILLIASMLFFAACGSDNDNNSTVFSTGVDNDKYVSDLSASEQKTFCENYLDFVNPEASELACIDSSSDSACNACVASTNIDAQKELYCEDETTLDIAATACTDKVSDVKICIQDYDAILRATLNASSCSEGLQAGVDLTDLPATCDSLTSGCQDLVKSGIAVSL
jgi:hypothetical protein